MSNLNQFFNQEWYLAQNPDVAEAVNAGLLNAFDHFTNYGITEGRSPSPFFDVDFYLAQNPDVAQAVEAGVIHAVEHFLLYGVNEPRQISVAINMADYLRANPDVAAAAESGLVSPLAHLLQYGVTEGRDLGNGVSLAQFANDPVFQNAISTGQGLAALARVEEVAPFIPEFKAPVNWTPPVDLPLPTNFVPVAGQKLVVPEGVTVPTDMDLPDNVFAPAEPTEPPVTGGGSGGSGGTPGGTPGGAEPGGSNPDPDDSDSGGRDSDLSLDQSVVVEQGMIPDGAITLAVTAQEGAELDGVAQAVNVNLANVTGLKELVSVNSKEKLAFINVQNSVDLTIEGGAKDEIIRNYYQSEDGEEVFSEDLVVNRKNVILNYADNEENIALTEQTINLKDALVNNITAQVVSDQTLVESDLQALTINVTGQNIINRAGTYTTDSAITQSTNTKVTVQGEGSLTWNILDGALESFDATGVEGEVVLNRVQSTSIKEITTGEANDTVIIGYGGRGDVKGNALNISTGAGDDVIDLAIDKLDRQVKVDAGEGNDVIVANVSGSEKPTMFELKGGEGADKFVIKGNGNSALFGKEGIESVSDEEFFTNVVITDFNSEEDTLILGESFVFSFVEPDFNEEMGLVEKVYAASEVIDLDDTVDSSREAEAVIFEHGANTYVVYAGTTVIQLAGTGHNLDENSVIGDSFGSYY